MNRQALLLAAATLAAGTAQAACYGVYKADGTLLQETATTPVDLTHPIGDTVPVKFGPGATMTISEGVSYCRDASQDLGAQNSLAAAVLAEEKKAMVLKAPAAKVEPAAVQVAKEEPAARKHVARQEGNVLKVKGREAQ